MTNNEVLILILLTLNLLLSIYNFYQSHKKVQPKEKLTCSSLFCSFTCENKEEMEQHEQEHEKS